MEKSFKKGDKVRYIGGAGTWIEFPIGKGAEGVIISDENSFGMVGVKFCGPDYLDVDDLELIEPVDRKTEFLSRLHSLLKEFDAEIWQDNGNFDIYFDGKYELTIEGGEYKCFTAENVNNFD